jgi:hypothetical protein
MFIVIYCWRFVVVKTFVIDPLVGVGPVRLGARREAVLAAIGAPENSFCKVPGSRHQTDAWFQNGLQVFYEGDQPTVAFIELTSSPYFEAVLLGISVFTTKVPLVISEIRRCAKLDEADPELGYAYTFPSLELALWRPDDDDAETPYFSTVGIGVCGYYSS